MQRQMQGQIQGQIQRQMQDKGKTNLIKNLVRTLKQVLDIKNKESVLVVTDKKKRRIAKLFEKAAKHLSNNVDFLEINLTGRHGAEPSKEEAKKMFGYDVLILLTTYSLTHTDARRNACKRGARAISMPGFTLNMLNAVLVDYKKMQKDSLKLWHELEKARKKKETIFITTPHGSNLRLGILEKVYLDIGKVKKGQVENLPAGEVFFAPKNAKGVLVIDRYENKIKKSVKLEVYNNKIMKYPKTREGRIIRELLSVPKGNFMAEFGIGTNQNAKIIGNTLQDEKVRGTAHIAFGNNLSMGGKNNAKVHIDFILFKPTIKVGSRLIMKEGMFLV